MSAHEDHEWRWHRCSIVGCGAAPLRVRRHPHLSDRWSVGYTDGPVWVIPGPEPLCPRCGSWLEALAPASQSLLARMS